MAEKSSKKSKMATARKNAEAAKAKKKAVKATKAKPTTSGPAKKGKSLVGQAKKK